MCIRDRPTPSLWRNLELGLRTRLANACGLDVEDVRSGVVRRLQLHLVRALVAERCARQGRSLAAAAPGLDDHAGVVPALVLEAPAGGRPDLEGHRLPWRDPGRRALEDEPRVPLAAADRCVLGDDDLARRFVGLGSG